MDGTVQMDAGKVNEGRDGGKRDAGRELSQWGKRRREETGNGCGEGDQGLWGLWGLWGLRGLWGKGCREGPRVLIINQLANDNM